MTVAEIQSEVGRMDRRRRLRRKILGSTVIGVVLLLSFNLNSIVWVVYALRLQSSNPNTRLSAAYNIYLFNQRQSMPRYVEDVVRRHLQDEDITVRSSCELIIYVLEKEHKAVERAADGKVERSLDDRVSSPSLSSRSNPRSEDQWSGR